MSAHAPLLKFNEWFLDAKSAMGKGAEIAALGTVGADNIPSVRMINYKGQREGGFSFFTNLESVKGLDIKNNPTAAMTFFWASKRRQVRVRGACKELSTVESDAYFETRDLGSQVTATLSKQSRPIESSFDLFLNQCSELESTKPILPRPKHWGGLVLVPNEIEFWEGGESRRHHRRHFFKNQDHWTLQELYP